MPYIITAKTRLDETLTLTADGMEPFDAIAAEKFDCRHTAQKALDRELKKAAGLHDWKIQHFNRVIHRRRETPAPAIVKVKGTIEDAPSRKVKQSKPIKHAGRIRYGVIAKKKHK